ncbi:glutamate-5-semialdehyde dehydrogenase [Lacihabitans sp. LS3-19]|uniref:glutamate-5-semialdehyde dehydrogenase n=1 Tax=Lacihabitans sp. LS3-19 TaxID=2487335 RepID=UPI0020CC78BC|nr:glutamate-5-semialdehyde dehydrogenase [Lacihabitans sp. LS3-19]MCP9770616.1 glutamate-5-semialdehyde dehydrogenase [Lacihabitans sp. LS3-19]
MESIEPLLKNTHKAASQIRRLSRNQKAKILTDLAKILLENSEQIIQINKDDLDLMDPADAKYDRLLLNENRIKGLADALEEVSKLNDPSGQILTERTLDSGIKMQKISVPMGVVGAIFESRPNVTIDVASLCIRSGNACVLKGGKEAHFSNQFLVSLIHEALAKNGVSSNAVMLLPTDRKYLAQMLEADKYVDLIIPRGSQSLIDYVRSNSKIPTIETGAGVCHTYIEKTANLEMAAEIIVNARASRPSVCNSLDCAILDEAVLENLIPLLKEGFEKYNIEVFADDKSHPVFEKNGFAKLQHAQVEDFGKEWLDFKISIKTVNSFGEALEHINLFSSKHSEAIITENQSLAETFLQEVDAASVYHNASTRFTDGGEFGLGAEIGISTQKLHARGPFALEKLVTEKWICRGNGQVRW